MYHINSIAKPWPVYVGLTEVNLKCFSSYFSYIGLFKMFSRWIWGIFNNQIQSDKRHKLMLFIFQNKDKDLLGIYQYGCDPFCVSLLTDRHLKVRSNSILFTFSDKGTLTSARDS